MKKSSGALFKITGELLSHEKIREFQNWYETDRLYGDQSQSYVTWETLVVWLGVNKDKIKEFLGVI